MANKPTVSWNENTPAGTESRSLGDDRIRELKSQLREVIGADHEMESSGQDTDWGYHNHVTLVEAADIGTGADGVPILGAQTSDGKAELFFTDEDDNDIQLTEAGSMGGTGTDLVINTILASGAVEIGGALSVYSTFEVTDVFTADSINVTEDVTISGTASSTPDVNTLYANNMIKAWVVFDGTGTNPITVSAGFNIDGTVTKASTGRYTINWYNDFDSANYAISAICGSDSVVSISSISAGSISIEVNDNTNGAGSPADEAYISIMAVGLQA